MKYIHLFLKRNQFVIFLKQIPEYHQIKQSFSDMTIFVIETLLKIICAYNHYISNIKRYAFHTIPMYLVLLLDVCTRRINAAKLSNFSKQAEGNFLLVNINAY